MVRNAVRGNTCGYCTVCVRARLCAARGRSPEPLECAYKHILEAYTSSDLPGKLPESSKSATPCDSCRWTSDAQFPETPPSSSDLSFAWSSQSSIRSRIRRRKR